MADQRRTLAALIPLMLLLGGCLPNRQPTVRVVEVAVPVPIECPAPPAMSTPVLPIHLLTEQATAAEVANAYVVSLRLLLDAVKARDIVLDGYRSDGQP